MENQESQDDGRKMGGEVVKYLVTPKTATSQSFTLIDVEPSLLTTSNLSDTL